MKCPCPSGKEYAACCEPVIRGKRKASTAEELMRSRYSAYALGEVDWIVASQCEEGRQIVDREATAQWSKQSTWRGMEVLTTQEGGADDQQGLVEFKAHYTVNGEDITHHEVAHFRRENNDWVFVDGIEVKPRPFKRATAKVGANDPCPCNSGKKYKKCCGRAGA